MEQGTGKTITTLELIRIRYEAGKVDTVIWLCPCSAKGNIKREIIKQCPEGMLEIFTICGIETLSSSVRAVSYLLSLAGKKKCFLVVDESLMVKNPKAYRTANIQRIADKCGYRLILNGTPISRNEADLFSQFFILDWRILGYRSYWSFSANHLEFDEYGKLHRVLNTDRLAEKMAPYVFQVRKKDCTELPKKDYSVYYFGMTEEQEKEYDRVAEILMMQVDEWKPETVYRLFSGLQAVISGKRLLFDGGGEHFRTEEMFDDPLDNPRITKLMDVLPKDEKAIIFCRYESEIGDLCRLLPGAVRFDGKVTAKGREQALKEFAEEKKYLVANRNCAGYSLNLQFCRNIVYMSNDWDLGTRLQSEDRVHRIGQDRTVYIMDICASDTLDERILQCLWRKERLLDAIKDEVELKSESGVRKALERCIYGGRGKRSIFDCEELEETDGESI